MDRVEYTSMNRKSGVTRRQLVYLALGLCAAVPAGYFTSMAVNDAMTPRVATPDLVFVDGWVLDSHDNISTSAALDE